MSRTRTMINLARHERRAEQLAKGQAAPSKPPARLTIDPKKPKRPRPTYTPAGGYVRVQRPGLHEQPALARLLSVGKHGITVADDQGRPMRVRHEHVLEGHAAPSGQERALFAGALASQGIPVPLEERFLKQDHVGSTPRRPTASQLALMEAVTAHGVPYDVPTIAEHATWEEAERLISMFVSDPKGEIGAPVKGNALQGARS